METFFLSSTNPIIQSILNKGLFGKGLLMIVLITSYKKRSIIEELNFYFYLSSLDGRFEEYD
jgi:hypothetical protein